MPSKDPGLDSLRLKFLDFIHSLGCHSSSTISDGYLVDICCIIPIYLLARIALLVEAFFSLRSLPPGAYSVVNWTGYLPHI
jgi:hypothetical protein